MAKLTQYIPSFVDHRSLLKTAEVATSEGLLQVDWINVWTRTSKFHRFCWHPNDPSKPNGYGSLVVELDEGERWWVVASSDHSIPGLPLWDPPRIGVEKT